MSQPRALAVDANDNLWIVDRGNGVIRLVNFTTQLVSTFAGTVCSRCGGSAPAVVFAGSSYLTRAACANFVMRDMVSTIADVPVPALWFTDVPALGSTFKEPYGIAVTATHVLVADKGHMVIRNISIRAGKIGVLAGSGIATTFGDGTALAHTR